MVNQDALLEIYKLQAELADRISQRRNASNQFYIGILSAIFLLFSFGSSKDLTLEIEMYKIYFLASSLGILICIIWLLNINSLRKLNSEKFKVLHELESQLPFAFFQKEWSLLNREKHISQSTVEKLVPLLFTCLYVFILIYAIANF